MFNSYIEDAGSIEFPKFSNLRIMMMPFLLENVEETLPEFARQYLAPVISLIDQSVVVQGVAYLTIDEALVKKGETHRRPGLHVDGIGPDGKAAGWGGGGGYACNGMLTASTYVGCRAWCQEFDGFSKPNGDCEHLKSQCRTETLLQPNRMYYLNSMAVHEAVVAKEDVYRQFIRLSMPSTAPWYEGYTKNPLGVKPTGPIHKPRTEFMNFRSDKKNEKTI